ncbi:MAG: hypothetical protein GX112_05935 [Clostridiaceae bacterium]|nr:hypothetical protein [Clostridiaceae bacterium]
MRLFFRACRIGLQRAILSRRFAISLGFLLVAMLLSVWGFIANAADAIYLLGLTRSGTANAILYFCLLPTFPFATSFAGEWNEGAVPYWVIRLGSARYAVSKAVVTALSGFIYSACGMLVFIGLLSLNMPLFVRSSSGDVYSVLLDQGRPAAYLFFYVTHFALSSALFAVAALWVSSFIPHVFTAITGPLVLYFALHRLTSTLDIPNELKAGAIVEQITGSGSCGQALARKALIVGLLVLVLGSWTVHNIQKKVRHA